MPGSKECFHTEYSYQLLSCLSPHLEVLNRFKKKKYFKNCIQSMLVHINNLHLTLAAKYADFGILVFCLVGLFLVFLFTNVQYLFLARTICVLTE